MSENRPLVVGEARRCGLAIVATDLGGLRELIHHEQDGLLFRRSDAQALASTLRRLSRDRALLSRLAAARPPLVGMDEVSRSTEALYRELAAGVAEAPTHRSR